MPPDPPTLSVSEVAAATGFSRQAVYRAVRDGRLSRFLIRDDAGHARLMPEAVVQIRRGLLRQRIDTAPPATPPPPAPEAAAEPPSWDDVAGWGNALIDRTAFGPAPWSPTMWSSLSYVIEMACELAGEHGAATPEALAAFEAEAEADE
jgi:hypothetical protein